MKIHSHVVCFVTLTHSHSPLNLSTAFVSGTFRHLVVVPDQVFAQYVHNLEVGPTPRCPACVSWEDLVGCVGVGRN